MDLLALLLILGLGLTCLALAGVLMWRTLRPWDRAIVRRRVIVNLRGGNAISGVLFERRGPLLVLRNATLHEGGQTISVDGDAVVDRAQVEWIQSLNVAES